MIYLDKFDDILTEINEDSTRQSCEEMQIGVPNLGDPLMANLVPEVPLAAASFQNDAIPNQGTSSSPLNSEENRLNEQFRRRCSTPRPDLWNQENMPNLDNLQCNEVLPISPIEPRARESIPIKGTCILE